MKWLVISDEITRESLSLQVTRNLTSKEVIDTLADLFANRSIPEITANALRRRLGQLEIQTLYIELGSTWRNG